MNREKNRVEFLVSSVLLAKLAAVRHQQMHRQVVGPAGLADIRSEVDPKRLEIYSVDW